MGRGWDLHDLCQASKQLFGKEIFLSRLKQRLSTKEIELIFFIWNYFLFQQGWRLPTNAQKDWRVYWWFLFNWIAISMQGPKDVILYWSWVPEITWTTLAVLGKYYGARNQTCIRQMPNYCNIPSLLLWTFKKCKKEKNPIKPYPGVLPWIWINIISKECFSRRRNCHRSMLFLAWRSQT